MTRLFLLAAAPLVALSLSGCALNPLLGHRAMLAQSAPRPAPAARADYEDMIAKHADEAGVPAEVADAVVRIESGYNPSTTGREGEVGLMQIKYETAQSLGYDGDRDGLYDPDTNLTYGMKYLAEAQKLGGGDLCGTMLRYQGGLYATHATPASAAYCDQVRRFIQQG